MLPIIRFGKNKHSDLIEIHFEVFNFKIVIFQEEAGIISPGPIWVAFQGRWMYTGDTFLGLLWNLFTGWNKDRNLVG